MAATIAAAEVLKDVDISQLSGSELSVLMRTGRVPSAPGNTGKKGCGGESSRRGCAAAREDAPRHAAGSAAQQAQSESGRGKVCEAASGGGS